MWIGPSGASYLEEDPKAPLPPVALVIEDQSVARTENEKILATSAFSEAPLERQKMIILFMKIRLLSLQSRAICN